MDLESTYRLTLVILGTGLSIKALETLHLLPEYASRRALDFEIAGDDLLLGSRFSGGFNALYSRSGVLALSCLSILSFLLLLFTRPHYPEYRYVVLAFILANVAMYFRQGFGLDGADQMALLILVTVLLCFVASERPGVQLIGTWFIALQLGLSYFVSGAAKLLSREWRSGVAIEGILSTYTYGTNSMRWLVTRRRPLCLLLAWGVIVTEIALPFALLFGARGVAIGLTIGLLLHVSIAVVMGLNDFVWSFAAAYPSFYYVGAHVLG